MEVGVGWYSDFQDSRKPLGDFWGPSGEGKGEGSKLRRIIKHAYDPYRVGGLMVYRGKDILNPRLTRVPVVQRFKVLLQM